MIEAGQVWSRIGQSGHGGDRLYTDIAMGKAAGITSILVLSGETKSDDLAASMSNRT